MSKRDRDVLVALEGVIAGYYIPASWPLIGSYVLSSKEHADVIDFWWDYFVGDLRLERMLESEARARGHQPWIDDSTRSR